MKKMISILILLFVAVNINLLCFEKRSILVLHGFREITTWEKEFDNHYASYIFSQDEMNISISYDLLGLNDIPGDTRPDEIIQYLTYKNEKFKFDLVIGILQSANHFLYTYGDEIFHDNKKIFFIPPAHVTSDENSVIIKSASNIALSKTVKNICTLFPKTKSIIIISGTSRVDTYYRSLATSIIAQYPTITPKYYNGTPLDTILEETKKPDKNTVILFLSFINDENNVIYKSADVVNEIADNSNAPVFSFIDSYFGRGIIGGNLTNTFSYAREAAGISLEILKGKNVKDIRVSEQITNFMYDWRQLKRFNISEKQVPQGSIVKYQEYTFWDLYKYYAIIIITVILIQSVLIITLISSIIRKKSIEHELKLSEEKFKKVFDNNPIPMMVFDLEKRIILDVNEAFVKKIGYSREETIGIPGKVGFTIKDEVLVAKALRLLKETSKLTDFEIITFNKKGEPLTGFLYGEKIFFQNEEMYIISFVDITERKKVETALRENEEILSRIFTSTHFLLAYMDKDFNFIKVNQAYAHASLQEPDFFIGKNHFALYPNQENEEIFKQVVKTGKPYIVYAKAFEYPDQPELGVTYWDWTLLPVKDEKEAVKGVLLSLVDVTKQKQAELALKKSEHRYKSLFEGSVDGIVFVNNEGGFIDCNRSYSQMVGYSIDELRKLGSFYDITPKKWHEWEQREIIEKQIPERGFSDRYEKKYIKKDGTIFPVELTAYRLDQEENEKTTYWAIVRDITEIKKNTQILIQTQKLKSLGELAAGMAHEIFQPLSGILMATENLELSSIDNKVDPDTIQYATGNIKNYINRIKSIIEHVRIFSREQKAVSNDKININESIQNAVNLIDRQYKNNTITLKLDLTKELPLVEGNIYRFEQVVLNLLTNAKDAVLEKEKRAGKGTNKKEIGLTTYVIDNTVVFEIYDNGIGIPGENIEHLFDPFYTTKESGGGTGLGLSVTYGIIHEMNGTIYAESKEMEYARFIIKLPIKGGEDE